MATKPQSWIWDASEGVLIDKSRTSEYLVLEDPLDVWYVGYTRRFEALLVLLSVTGVYTGFSIKIWNGSEWVDSLIDYDLDASDYVRWNLREDVPEWTKLGFSETDPHAATPPDSKERYWLKFSATGVATAAKISSLEVVPFVQYTTPQLVSEFLQRAAGEELDMTTLPSENTVENFIRRHEAELDRVTQRSWRLNDATEYQEFNYSGIKLRHAPVRRLEKVNLWQGTSWRTLQQGRTGECYAVDDVGFVYFTRWFVPVFVPYSGGGAVLPFIFLYMLRYPIEITYQWGEDFQTSPEAPYVEDVATRMVAISLLEMSESSILTKAGVEKVELSAKVRLWKDEIKEGLASLARGFVAW